MPPRGHVSREPAHAAAAAIDPLELNASGAAIDQRCAAAQADTRQRGAQHGDSPHAAPTERIHVWVGVWYCMEPNGAVPLFPHPANTHPPARPPARPPHTQVYLKRVPDTLDAFFFGSKFSSNSSHPPDPDPAAATAAPPYDVTAMGEHGGINSGVVAARNTPAVHAMYDAWSRLITSRDSDQGQHLELRGKHWVPCRARGDCPGAGPTVAALARHNPPWGKGRICPPVDRSNHTHWVWYDGKGEVRDHCAVRERLYAHMICLGGSEKLRAAKALGLWFLDETDPWVTNEAAIAAAGLPCAPPSDVARLYVMQPAPPPVPPPPRGRGI